MTIIKDSGKRYQSTALQTTKKRLSGACIDRLQSLIQESTKALQVTESSKWESVVSDGSFSS